MEDEDEYRFRDMLAMRLVTSGALILWVAGLYKFYTWVPFGKFDFPDAAIGLWSLSILTFAFAAAMRVARGLKSWMAKLEFFALILGVAWLPLGCVCGNLAPRLPRLVERIFG